MNAPHNDFGSDVDDPRHALAIAELGGVRDAVPPALDSPTVQGVQDQFELIEAIEVGHFTVTPGFDKSLESAFDVLRDSAADDDLFAAKVGFPFLAESYFDDAGRGAAD